MAYILGSMSEEDPQGAAEPAVNLRDNAVAPARQTIAEILERLPAAPGVYIMKDRRGKAVYIGKAGVLRNRVRQYFQARRATTATSCRCSTGSSATSRRSSPRTRKRRCCSRTR